MSFVSVAAYTFFGTADRINWLLDAFWVVVGLPLLVCFRRNFPATPLLLRLLCLHAIVLIAGAYWTYEKNPLGLWFQEILGTSGNHYDDRLGHFIQGFVSAVLFREIYVRKAPLSSGFWLSYFSFVSCLGFSVCFEMLEWRATICSGVDGNEFLGHQGDVWDA